MRPANSGIRYTKQYDGYSCGPTVLINTLKWAGNPTSFKKRIKHYQTEVLCTKVSGTGVLSLDFALQGLPRVKIVTRYSNHHLFPKNPPKWYAMKAHLRQGGTLIVRYDWPDGKDAHYVLVTHLTSRWEWSIINPGALLIVLSTKGLCGNYCVKKKVWYAGC